MPSLPTRRWLVVAAALALGWPAAAAVPGGGPVLAIIDLGWVVPALGGQWRAPPAGALEVTREVPAAFSVGRALPIRYRWVSRHPRATRLVVREMLPPPLIGGRSAVERVIPIGAAGTATEILEVMPQHRGRGE